MIAYVYRRNHFALLKFNLKEKTITVFDGLKTSLSTWNDHIMQVLCRNNLIQFTKKKFDDIVKSKKTKKHWFIEFEPTTIQADGSSCGPICCYNACS